MVLSPRTTPSNPLPVGAGALVILSFSFESFLFGRTHQARRAQQLSIYHLTVYSYCPNLSAGIGNSKGSGTPQSPRRSRKGRPPRHLRSGCSSSHSSQAFEEGFVHGEGVFFGGEG